MLGTVGHAFAVNPDRALRRLAVERGWGALSFVRPVPLFPRRGAHRHGGRRRPSSWWPWSVTWIAVRRRRRRR